MSCIFQDVGQAIRVDDSRLNRIDVSKLGFLARREDFASSHHSLDVEIDQFRFEEAEEAPGGPVELSNFEHESDRFSTTHSPRLVVTRVDSSSEIEEEGMI